MTDMPSWLEGPVERVMSDTEDGILDKWNAFIDGLSFSEMLLGLVVCALAGIIGWILWKKISEKHKVKREAKKMEKDLQVWSDVSELARGGEATDEAKKRFANRAARLEADFAEGEAFLAKNQHVTRRLPWFLLVGEPSSGKSAFLEESGLELVPSASGDAPLLNFWTGGRGVVLDLEGRLFFDRWMGGSSAEMHALSGLIRRRHHARPLSGLIVTIPADALIADNQALTRKKAMLIAAELESLTARLGMVLPCHVVVTKLDHVLGFTDYFGGLSDQRRHQSLCWQPEEGANGSGFPESRVRAFWEKLTAKLRDGALARITELNRSGAFGEKENRMAATAGIYLFPEKLAQLEAPLETYLRAIFGADDYAGVPHVEFAGLSLTSARQEGGALDREIARSAGRQVDDLPIPDSARRESKPFFIRELLGKTIFLMTRGARFTRAEALKRNLPWYALAFVGVVLGSFWSWSALWQADAVKAGLREASAHYEALQESFEDGEVTLSPLLGNSVTGPVTLFDTTFEGTSRSRSSVFTEAALMAETPLKAPWGFKTASLFAFGPSMDLERSRRRTLFDALQTEMAFLPAVSILEENLADSGDEPFTIEKRRALFALLGISNYRSALGWESRIGNVLYKPETFDAFLDYLYPAMTDDTQAVLMKYFPSEDDFSGPVNELIVLSPEYSRATSAGITSLLKAHEAGTSYPKSEFQRLRGSLSHANELIDEYNAALLLGHSAQNFGAEEISANWRVLAERVKESAGALEEAAKVVLGNTTLRDDARTRAASRMQVRSFYDDYREAVEADYSALSSYLENNLNRHRLSGENGRLITPETLKSSQARAESVLEGYGESFVSQAQAVRSHPLFAPIKNETEDGKAARDIIPYQAFARLVELSIAPQAEGFEGIAGVPSAWMRLLEQTARQEEALGSFVRSIEKSGALKDIVPVARQMFRHTAVASRLDLAQKVLALYPQARSSWAGTSALASLIARSAADGEAAMDYALARSVLGTFGERPEFEPSSAAPWLQSFALVSAPADTKDEIAKGYAEALKALPRMKQVSGLMSGYAREYIRWWGTVVDNAKPLTAGWSQVRTLAASAPAHRINGELLAAYDCASHALELMPESLLGRSASKERKDFMATIDERRGILTVAFSEQAEKTLSNWALLPEDALSAKRAALMLPPEEVSAFYLGSTGGEPGAGQIPWWSAFTDMATRALNDGALASIEAELKERQISIRFPLLKDPSGEVQALSRDDLEVLSEVLLDFGCKGEMKTAAKDPANQVADLVTALAGNAKGTVSPIQAPLRTDPLGFTKAQCEQFQWTAGLLLGKKTLPQWTLLLPTAQRHAELLTQSGLRLPSALGRFRYLEAEAGHPRAASPLLRRSGRQGKKVRHATFSSKNPVRILGGPVTESSIKIALFPFSDSQEADGEIRIESDWAALRIWLHPLGIEDAEAGVVWAPFIVEDSLGARSVLFLGALINPKLPSPRSWATSQQLVDTDRRPVRSASN